MSQEAMKRVLEALEYTTKLSRFLLKDEANIGPMLKADEAITSLRQTIAEAEKQDHNFCSRCGKRTNDIHTCTPPRDNT